MKLKQIKQKLVAVVSMLALVGTVACGKQAAPVYTGPAIPGTANGWAPMAEVAAIYDWVKEDHLEEATEMMEEACLKKAQREKCDKLEAKYLKIKEPIAYALYEDDAVYKVTLDTLPASDDGKAYLFGLDPFEYEITEKMKPFMNLPLEEKLYYKFKLGFETENTRLYEKFCVAVLQDGKYVQVTDAKYIINPEVLAAHTRPYEPVEKAFQSLSMHNVFLDGSGSDFDVYLPMVCLLASTDPTNPTVHPDVLNPEEHSMNYYMYMLNGGTKEGVEALAKDCSAIAAMGGQTFIVANEVNERVWNYVAFSDWDRYVRNYVEAFRVCYNAIKSQNAEAKVLFSIGQDWDRNRPISHEEYYHYIDEKDFCDLFNAQMKAEGNVDWGVALHPYIVPLTYSKFWDMSGCPSGDYCKVQVDTGAMVSFQNMSIITDYLTTEEFLNPEGRPRYFIIGEMGLSNSQGEEVQSAALCALWQAYKMNPYIHELYYCNLIGYGVNPTLWDRTQEIWDELGAGTKKEERYMNWALSYIGIKDWTDIIRKSEVRN